MPRSVVFVPCHVDFTPILDNEIHKHRPFVPKRLRLVVDRVILSDIDIETSIGFGIKKFPPFSFFPATFFSGFAVAIRFDRELLLQFTILPFSEALPPLLLP